MRTRNRHKQRCYWCHARDVPLTKDHVVPLGFGGTDDIANIVRACVACNVDRNRIVTARMNVFRAAVHKERSQQKAIAGLAAIAPLIEKWATLERLRLGNGRSVSDKLGTAAHPFPVIPHRRAQTLESRVDVSRAVAEAKWASDAVRSNEDSLP